MREAHERPRPFLGHDKPVVLSMMVLHAVEAIAGQARSLLVIRDPNGVRFGPLLRTKWNISETEKAAMSQHKASVFPGSRNFALFRQVVTPIARWAIRIEEADGLW